MVSHQRGCVKVAFDRPSETVASAPLLDEFPRRFTRCAVHQQTQRLYVVGENHDGSQALAVLDADLRLLATVEVESRWRLTRGVAVDGDQVVVLRGCDADADAVSGLRLLDLDGSLVRTIADGLFIDPQAVAASRGRAYVLDQDGDERAVADAEPEAEPDAMDDAHQCTGRSARPAPERWPWPWPWPWP